MLTDFLSVIVIIRSWFRTRASLQVEILASPPPGRRPQEVSAPPASSKLWGPTALGWAIAHLVAMALGVAYREARDRHRLASQGIPTVLEVEESPSGRTTLRVG